MKKTVIAIFFSVLPLPALQAQQAAAPSAIPVEKFAQLPVIREARLSPDGSHLAYIRPFRGRGHLIIQNLETNGQPVVTPPSEDADFNWLHWANNERLVFSISAMRKRGIVETIETRLWAMNKDGSEPEHIVKPSSRARVGTSVPRPLADAQIQDDVINWLPDEPNHILVSLDGDHNASDEVRKIDIRDGDFREVRNDAASIQNWLTDQDGDLRLGWGYRNSAFRLLAKNTNNMWRSAEKADWWDAGFFPQGFTKSPDVVYMRGPNSDGVLVIRTMNIDSGEFLETVFERDGFDAGSMIMDPVTQQPVGVSYTEHLPRDYYFDEEMAILQRSIDAAVPATTNRIVSMTSDRRKVLIHSFSDVDPGTMSILNRDKGTLSLISEIMPGLPPELMSPVEPVSYKARDGLTIPAYLTVPRGKARENLSMVVMPHGGPESRDDKSFWFLSQFLASRGYAVFQPNFRGSSGYGRGFQYAGRNEWGGKMQEDVTDGVEWLIGEGIADPARICIVGWSYGGYSAAMGAVQTPALYQCAASINGVLDLQRMIVDDRKYIGGSVWTQHVGLEDESAKTVSPYHQAERIQVPMLIIQAKDDARVPEDQGKRMANRLKRLDKPYEYVTVDLGGHSMTNEPARLTILQSVERFLAANLPPD